MAFRKHHGITLANNSWIENMHVERLAADPSPLVAGRLWYNETDKLLRFSTLDAGGAVVIRAIASAEQLQSEIANLNSTLTTYVDDEIALIQGQVDALGNAFNYVGVLPAQTGVTGTGTDIDPFVLDGMSPGFKDAGDYYKVTQSGYYQFGVTAAIYVDVNDGLVFNTAGTLDRINNQQSDVAGTTDEVVVTGSVETGFVVSIAQAIKDSIAANTQAVADEASRAQSVEGDLVNLTTTDKTNLVAAVNEVDANADANATAIAQEVTDRTAADTALQGNIDAEVTARGDADALIQGELDATQAGAGLGTDGAYVANATANYIATATSLKGADDALDAALKAEADRAAAAEAVNAQAIADEVTRATGAEGTLQGNIDAEAQARAAADGDLTTLATTDKTNLVAAINEVLGLAGDGTDALKTAINGKKAIYTAATAQLSHTFNHGFAGSDLVVTVLVYDSSNSKWYNDSVLVEVDPATTTVTVPLQVAAIVKIIVEDLSDIA